MVSHVDCYILFCSLYQTLSLSMKTVSAQSINDNRPISSHPSVQTASHTWRRMHVYGAFVCTALTQNVWRTTRQTLRDRLKVTWFKVTVQLYLAVTCRSLTLSPIFGFGKPRSSGMWNPLYKTTVYKLLSGFFLIISAHKENYFISSFRKPDKMLCITFHTHTRPSKLQRYF